LTDCNLEGSQFISCEVGEGTRFNGTAADLMVFSGLVRKDGGRRIEVYDPVKMRRMLVELGAILPPEVEAGGEPSAEVSARVELAERLLRHARTHYYLSRLDQWYVNNLEGHPQWPAVERLLRNARLIEDTRFDKSGPRETFVRFAIAPDKILQARAKADEKTPPTAVQFWRDIAS
jgi:hypothetical protein